MTKIEKAEFTCLRDGLTIRGTQYVPEHEGKIPAVIASHGFMGDRRNNAMYADFYTIRAMRCLSMTSMAAESEQRVTAGMRICRC